MKQRVEDVIKERGLGALSAYHVSVLLSGQSEGARFMVPFKKRKVCRVVDRHANTRRSHELAYLGDRAYAAMQARGGRRAGAGLLRCVGARCAGWCCVLSAAGCAWGVGGGSHALSRTVCALWGLGMPVRE